MSTPALGEVAHYEDAPNDYGVVVRRVYDHSFHTQRWTYAKMLEVIQAIQNEYADNPLIQCHRIPEWLIWVRRVPNGRAFSDHM